MFSPTETSIQKAFNVVAVSSLFVNGGSLHQDNIDCEAARIERCVEHFYINEDHNLHYHDYAAKFLMDRYHDIVYSNVYCGDWLQGIV